MILELADIRIRPAENAAFDESVQRAIVDQFLAQPPQVEHFTLLAKSARGRRRDA